MAMGLIGFLPVPVPVLYFLFFTFTVLPLPNFRTVTASFLHKRETTERGTL